MSDPKDASSRAAAGEPAAAPAKPAGRRPLLFKTQSGAIPLAAPGPRSDDHEDHDSDS